MSNCTEEYYAFSQNPTKKPKLWTRRNFCSKNTLKKASIRLEYLTDLTRKIKEHCKANLNPSIFETGCQYARKKHENYCYLFVKKEIQSHRKVKKICRTRTRLL